MMQPLTTQRLLTQWTRGVHANSDDPASVRQYNFLPELYFVRREQKIAYAEGYENAGLPTPLSRRILEKETR